MCKKNKKQVLLCSERVLTVQEQKDFELINELHNRLHLMNCSGNQILKF